jgi:hypothetical protein
MAALLHTAPVHAGNGSAIGAGLVGFGLGAILGSALAPPEVYFVPPPPPEYYGPEEYDGPEVYGPPPGTPNWYGHRAYPRPKTMTPAAAHGVRPEPRRSATAKTGALTSAVAQKSEAKFKAAQAKAKRLGVAALTQEDIDGLSYEQIKQIRGY